MTYHWPETVEADARSSEPSTADVASIIEVLAPLYPDVPIVELMRQVTEVLMQGRNLLPSGL